jgi:hypothetical protein
VETEKGGRLKINGVSIKVLSIKALSINEVSIKALSINEVSINKVSINKVRINGVNGIKQKKDFIKHGIIYFFSAKDSLIFL